MRIALIGILIILIGVSTPAFAQSRKELAAQNAALAARVQLLESRMLTGDPAAERLMQRIDGLEASQRGVTGEVEQLRFERDNLRAEIAALSEDVGALQALAARMRTHLDAVDLVASDQKNITQGRIYGGDPNVGLPSAPDPSAPLASPFAGAPTSDDRFTEDDFTGAQPSQVPSAPIYREGTLPVQENFNDVAALPVQGQTRLAEGDFIAAQTTFEQYLNLNPDAPDAGEVSFWLGETYFVRGQYTDAADAYISSIRKDPQGVRAPEAMVGLAATLRQLGNAAEACQTLDSFPTQFPDAPASVREKARVERTRTGC